MKQFTLTLLTFLLCLQGYSQSKRLEGKAVPGFGSTYEVVSPTYPTHLEEEFKVVFDVSSAPEDPSVRNKWVETVARFLNMHVAAGKSKETLKAAVTLHGNASYGLLKESFYKEKFGVSNPNTDLFKALQEAGVQLIFCGQTAAHRNLTPERRLEGLQVSLSAMTALIQLQNQGYQLINFN